MHTQAICIHRYAHILFLVKWLPHTQRVVYFSFYRIDQTKRGNTFLGGREETSPQGMRKLVNIKKTAKKKKEVFNTYISKSPAPTPVSPFLYLNFSVINKNLKGKKSIKRNIVGSSSRCLLKSLNYKNTCNLLLSNRKNMIKEHWVALYFVLKILCKLENSECYTWFCTQPSEILTICTDKQGHLISSFMLPDWCRNQGKNVQAGMNRKNIIQWVTE